MNQVHQLEAKVLFFDTSDVQLYVFYCSISSFNYVDSYISLLL